MAQSQVVPFCPVTGPARPISRTRCRALIFDVAKNSLEELLHFSGEHVV
jgi:hypothetical protein